MRVDRTLSWRIGAPRFTASYNNDHGYEQVSYISHVILIQVDFQRTEVVYVKETEPCIQMIGERLGLGPYDLDLFASN